MELKKYLDRLTFMEKLWGMKTRSPYSPLYADIINELGVRKVHRLAYADKVSWKQQMNMLVDTKNVGAIKHVDFELIPLMAYSMDVVPRHKLEELMHQFSSIARNDGYYRSGMTYTVGDVSEKTHHRITGIDNSYSPFHLVSIHDMTSLPYLLREFGNIYQKHERASCRKFVFMDFTIPEVHDFMSKCFSEFHNILEQAMFKYELYSELYNEDEEYIAELRATEDCTIPASIIKQLEIDIDERYQQKRRHTDRGFGMGLYNEHIQEFDYSRNFFKR